VTARLYSRPYVGVRKSGEREVFRSKTVPTEASHGVVYRYAVGPFRTRRAAELMRRWGSNNPHLVTVAQAERLANCKHVQDNQGLCHKCGVLLNLELWEAFAGKGAPPP